MPDQDWDADEREARAASSEKRGEGIQDSCCDVVIFLEGWDAAIEWMKRAALLRMLGGQDESPGG